MPRPKKPSTVRLAKDKREEITALLVYFIQALGTATTKEICDAIRTRVSVIIAPGTVEGFLDALYRRRIIAKRSREEDLQQKTVWSMEQAINLGKARETAHYKDIIAAVMASDGSVVVAEVLEHLENTGKKKDPGWPRDMYYVRLWFVTLEPMFGGWPLSPFLAEMLARSPFKCKDAEVSRAAGQVLKREGKVKKAPSKTDIDVMRHGMLYFLRSHDGRLALHSQIVRGFLRQLLARLNMSPAFQKKMAAPTVHITPTKPLLINQVPIIGEDPVKVGGDGKGLSSMETLQPLETFTMTVGFPRTNGIEPAQFKRAALEMGLLNARSMSPAKGAAVGKMLLTHFEELGNGIDMDAIEEMAGGELAAEHAAFLASTLRVQMPSTQPITTVEDVEEAAKNVKAAVLESGRRENTRRWTPEMRREWMSEYICENGHVTVAQIAEAFESRTGLDRPSHATLYTDLKEIGATNGDGGYSFKEDPEPEPTQPAA